MRGVVLLYHLAISYIYIRTNSETVSVLPLLLQHNGKYVHIINIHKHRPSTANER